MFQHTNYDIRIIIKKHELKHYEHSHFPYVHESVKVRRGVSSHEAFLCRIIKSVSFTELGWISTHTNDTDNNAANFFRLTPHFRAMLRHSGICNW